MKTTCRSRLEIAQKVEWDHGCLSTPGDPPKPGDLASGVVSCILGEGGGASDCRQEGGGGLGLAVLRL